MAVENGVVEIGKVLNLFYNQQQSLQKPDMMNELANQPIILN